MSYTAKKYQLSGLNGISDQTLEMHFKLYEGYVKNTNLLQEQIESYLESDVSDSKVKQVYSELKRRYGFEFNGMVLHELYFENLTTKNNDPDAQSAFIKSAKDSFGEFKKWKQDFTETGSLRGVGWAICYEDQKGKLSNHWVDLHESGNVAGYNPILVMDVWEHAYLKDYAPSERDQYIDAFFSNIDWKVVNDRIASK